MNMAPFPAGACDTHVHGYDASFPTAATALLNPPDAGPAEYDDFRAALGLRRVVVVQPTTYGFDNSCQLEFAAHYGDDARLVVVVHGHTTSAELARLDAAGARAARFHMLPGGAVGWEALPATADRIAELGWHVQLQLNGRLLPDHLITLSALPTALVIDHVGRFMPPVTANDPAFAALLALLDAGRCWVKLSAPYESTPDGAPCYPAVTALVGEIVRRFPERMLWASNWPHPGQQDPPSADDLHRLTAAWLATDDLRRQVLVDNPAELYGFPPIRVPSHQERP